MPFADPSALPTERLPLQLGTLWENKRFSRTILASFLGNARSARVTNPSRSIQNGICRRSLLKSVPVIAGAIISTNALTQNLFAQQKLTHEAAKYQDHPNKSCMRSAKRGTPRSAESGMGVGLEQSRILALRHYTGVKNSGRVPMSQAVCPLWVISGP